MNKERKKAIYNSVKEEIDNMKDGDYIVFTGDTHIERDDQVEFQPMFLVNEDYTESRKEVIAIVCREIFHTVTALETALW